MLRTELFRAFINRFFVVSVVLGVFALTFGLLDYEEGPDPSEIPGASPFLNNAFDAFLWAENNLFALLAPLLATIPFSDSLITDRAQGYQRMIFARLSRRKYLYTKYLANILAGGASLSLPLGLLYVYTNIKYPRGFPAPIEARIPYNSIPGPFGYLYHSNPDEYILFLIGLAFFFGATYASMGLAISLAIHNRYIALASPFLLFTTGNFLLSVIRLESWSPPATLVPYSYNATSWASVLGEVGAIFFVVTAGYFIFSKRTFRDV